MTVLLQSAMRGVGDAVTPLWATVLNLVLSLVLNPMFILGWGPVPAMGLPGAAWAGVVTNAICLIFMVARTYRSICRSGCAGRNCGCCGPIGRI